MSAQVSSRTHGRPEPCAFRQPPRSFAALLAALVASGCGASSELSLPAAPGADLPAPATLGQAPAPVPPVDSARVTDVEPKGSSPEPVEAVAVAPDEGAAPEVAPADTTPEPEPEPAPSDDRPRLHAPAGLVKIHSKPDRDSPVIGAMRAGQSVLMKDTTVTYLTRHKRLMGCEEGWFPVEPRGWVCVGGGDHATRDGDDPRVIAAKAALPDVSADYPFRYGVSIGAPQYRRLPTAEEQRQIEKNLDDHLASLPPADATKGGAIDATPAGRPPTEAFLRYQRLTSLPLVDEQPAFDGMKVAWTQEFDAHGRTWLLTPDMTLIPKDKVRQQPLPTLAGIDLRERTDLTLPLAFFWLDDSPKYRLDGGGKLVETDEQFARHSFVPTSMKQAKGSGGLYWQVGAEDEYVRYSAVSIIRKAGRPAGIGPNDKWVDIRVTWGYLVAYEGERPVYVTAMSPGSDGIANAKFATARGRHHVDWKMYSGDMSGRDRGADWYVQEVPWVQYYQDSFAAHGAWWHNDFGRPRSHGCINLPPAAGRFLFDWMEPPIPDGWYAVSPYAPDAPSTMLYIRH